MAGTTEHYGLACGVMSDDLIEAGHHNRLAETVDRVLGNVVKRLLGDGAYSGWEVTTDKQVTAGEGLIGGCWCTSIAAQAIEGLRNGAVNTVIGGTTTESGAKGSVRFLAQTGPTPPSGTIMLGTLELDEAGVVVAAASNPPGVDRNCRRLEIGHLQGSTGVTGVEASVTVQVTVEHSQELVVPGAIRLAGLSPGFTCEIQGQHSPTFFIIAVTNTGGAPADFACTWERWGLVA